MTIEYFSPTTEDVRTVENDLIRVLTQDRIIFKLMPIRAVQDTKLKWRMEGKQAGLMQIRGINGAPPEIQLVGEDELEMTPGYFAETVVLQERELLELAGTNGPANGKIDLSGKVAKAQETLLRRRIAIEEYLSWLLLTTGTFAVTGQNGQAKLKGQYDLSTFTSIVPWATHATATPLADLRQTKLKFRGSSTVWDTKAFFGMNQDTVNDLLANENPHDLGGKTINGGSSYKSLDDLNRIFVGEGIPPITVVEDGYDDDNGTFHLYVGAGHFVAVGRRPDGDDIGATAETIAVQNDYMPGAYTIVERDDKKTPPKVSVTHGVNGGPVLFYPKGVVAGDVGA